MKKQLDANARKAFVDYKLEISKELGATTGAKNKKMKKSENEYTHLGRS